MHSESSSQPDEIADVYSDFATAVERVADELLRPLYLAEDARSLLWHMSAEEFLERFLSYPDSK